ncbi:hypothetical protein [Chryseobacterium gossypii]|uniref:hypothetical protein n=1 Tax=Chryseobacterium gossypii TaxID=3231602 RepID=UPI00352392CB
MRKKAFSLFSLLIGFLGFSQPKSTSNMTKQAINGIVVRMPMQNRRQKLWRKQN